MLLAVFGAGVALLYWRRTTVWGRRWLTAAVAAYWIAATPLGSTAIAWPLASRYHPLASRADANGAQAVVMLGGGITPRVVDGVGLDDLGASALRLIETARVYHLLGNPLVIVCGGDLTHLDPPRPEAHAYRAAAISLGVPADRIVAEDRSLTTRDQALLVKPILAQHHVDRFVLVTSPTHMGRSLAAFRAVGLTAIPSAAPLRPDNSPSRWSLLPDRESLFISDSAVYDGAAYAYYVAHGWVR